MSRAHELRRAIAEAQSEKPNLNSGYRLAFVNRSTRQQAEHAEFLKTPEPEATSQPTNGSNPGAGIVDIGGSVRARLAIQEATKPNQPRGKTAREKAIDSYYAEHLRRESESKTREEAERQRRVAQEKKDRAERDRQRRLAEFDFKGKQLEQMFVDEGATDTERAQCNELVAREYAESFGDADLHRWILLGRVREK